MLCNYQPDAPQAQYLQGWQRPLAARTGIVRLFGVACDWHALFCASALYYGIAVFNFVFVRGLVLLRVSLLRDALSGRGGLLRVSLPSDALSGRVCLLRVSLLRDALSGRAGLLRVSLPSDALSGRESLTCQRPYLDH